MMFTILLAATAAATPIVAQDTPGLAPKLVSESKAAIADVLEKGCQAFAAGDISGAMAPYSEDVLLYDIAPPYRTSYQQLKEANAALRGMMAETPRCTYKDMQITIVAPDFAYAIYLLPYAARLKNGRQLNVQGRGTDLFRKIDGKWMIVHEHFSVPADPMTGKAELVPPE